MQNRQLESIKKDIHRYFEFLFDKGYEIRDTHYHADAFGNWEISLESQKNAITIYQERNDLMLSFRPKDSDKKEEIRIEPMILYLTNGKSFIPPYNGNLLWGRKKQFERLSRLTFEWIDQIELNFKSGSIVYKEELPNPQKAWNDFTLKWNKSKKNLNFIREKK